ncbi:MAG TPA: hypothetical protein VGR91_08035 [Stellaceae bacterium]|nr:hypothetical protein [Stellaceae bacterium]
MSPDRAASRLLDLIDVSGLLGEVEVACRLAQRQIAEICDIGIADAQGAHRVLRRTEIAKAVAALDRALAELRRMARPQRRAA